jgi:hypothetical protein
MNSAKLVLDYGYRIFTDLSRSQYAQFKSHEESSYQQASKHEHRRHLHRSVPRIHDGKAKNGGPWMAGPLWTSLRGSLTLVSSWVPVITALSNLTTEKNGQKWPSSLTCILYPKRRPGSMLYSCIRKKENSAKNRCARLGSDRVLVLPSSVLELHLVLMILYSSMIAFTKMLSPESTGRVSKATRD